MHVPDASVGCALGDVRDEVDQETGFYPVARRLSPATAFADRFHTRSKATAYEGAFLVRAVDVLVVAVGAEND